MSMHVKVTGQWIIVDPLPEWTIGAIATDARWQGGCGETPFGRWEIRDLDGMLLDPRAMPENITALVVNLKAVGELPDWRAIATQAVEALRFTREYVGEAMLPEIEGWSWWDATEAFKAAVLIEDGVARGCPPRLTIGPD